MNSLTSDRSPQARNVSRSDYSHSHSFSFYTQCAVAFNSTRDSNHDFVAIDTFTRFPFAKEDRLAQASTIRCCPPVSCSNEYQDENARSKTARSTSGSGRFAVASSTEIASSLSFGGNDSFVRLIPIPTTTARPFSVSIASARMPQIFRSPARRSLGHLMSVLSSQASRKASLTASAAMKVIKDH